MKKTLFLLSISFLLLQSCSSGDSDNNSNSTSISDVDGNVYQTVTICNQTWTKSNLNVSKYRNGDLIPQVTDNIQWNNLTTGAWCYYNNDPSNGDTYGKLYNWYAVNDPRGLAPQGWHIPTSDEYFNLAYYCLGGIPIAGGKMKSPGTIQSGTGLWESPNSGATNETGFTGLPGGFRDGDFYPNTFTRIGKNACFWTSSGNGTLQAYSWALNWQSTDGFLVSGALKDTGYSVRCIKD